MALLKLFAATLALSFAALAQPALAEGQLQGFGQFENAAGRLDVDTYRVVHDDGVDERVGLLSIVTPEKTISIAFSKGEFPTLWTLWRTAEGSQSGTWKPVGDFVETGTSDTSHLKMSAGPGVRFVIESPALGAFTTELMSSNFEGFESALQKAESYVAEGQK
jgi:hypothetical protein